MKKIKNYLSILALIAFTFTAFGQTPLQPNPVQFINAIVTNTVLLSANNTLPYHLYQPLITDDLTSSFGTNGIPFFGAIDTNTLIGFSQPYETNATKFYKLRDDTIIVFSTFTPSTGTDCSGKPYTAAAAYSIDPVVNPHTTFFQLNTNLISHYISDATGDTNITIAVIGRFGYTQCDDNGVINVPNMPNVGGIQQHSLKFTIFWHGPNIPVNPYPISLGGILPLTTLP